ncbi:hypothetical protein B0T18DRAFT_196636 [Schizothecium vesticola]|uniref:Uncharacterized protein n=1 Tax=Schizothecium vesticola TaxID=314040 RepID=A0AA40ERE6_9PEZI|nr:hypothetical protein B0T18DRAFT_196636 [Schizothecium vesticola]
MGLEFIDNRLSTVFFLTIFTSTRLLFFCSRQLWRCSGFLGFLGPTQEADNSRLFTSERACPFLSLFFFLMLEYIGGIGGWIAKGRRISLDGLLSGCDQNSSFSLP